MARVVLLQGGQAVPFDISDEETTLGRHPECLIQIDSNMVSRFHAKIVRDGNAYALTDLKSGNGSFINGKRLEPHNAVTLSHQDRLKFGPVLFRFESEAPQPEKSNPLKETEPVAGPAQTISFSGDDDEPSTIMSTVSSSDSLGLLSVRPEEKLKAVIGISRALAGVVETQRLLPKILDSLFDIFPYADRGCVLLKAESTGELIPMAQKHRRPDEDSTVKLSRTILNRVLEDKQGILSADAAGDSRFDASESISNLSIRSIMCVPLKNIDGDAVGVINLDTTNPFNQFTKDDLELLDTVAMQAALSYDAARLLSSYMEKQKQDSEMEIARSVQEAFLPIDLPKAKGYEFFASYDSAQAVGGDYYDVFQLPDNKIALSFGDVAGKGVPGALIMSRMSTVVQSTLQYVHEVGAAVTAINNHMCSKAVEGRFVTYVLVIIDLNDHSMELVNAGHASPLIRRSDGEIDEFPDDTIGIPIGIMEDYPYEVVRRQIDPGEMVVIVTDGVDEAMNPAGQLYTKERIVDFLKAAPDRAADVGRELLNDVRKHANGRPQNDDITIMTYGRNPLSNEVTDDTEC